MKYSNEWLLAQDCEFTDKDFLFFWGHQPARDGSMNKSCFSQWYEAGFDQNGQHYPTAEHWMMAGKARVFKDEETLAKILKVSHPHAAKKLGRQVKNYDNESWAVHRMKVVVEGNLLKFTQHADLQDFLLKTNDKILVEASPYDNIWGIGMAATANGISNPKNWLGLNLLGYALMEVRERLQTAI